MRLGLGPIDVATASRAELKALATEAAASSFDCVWLTERRTAGVGGALAAAAMVAQWVPIRVGAIVDIGLFHPLHLAEDIAVADVATAGSLEVMLRAAHDDPSVVKEHMHVMAAAVSGAHIQWEGLHLRVPAHLAENGVVPQRLSINPHAVQPVVPFWVLDEKSEWAGIVDQLGFGTASTWHRGLSFGPTRWRVPRAVLCPYTVEPADLVAAAGDSSGYFIVDARTPVEVREAGRRLFGALRMPDFPDWVNAER